MRKMKLHRSVSAILFFSIFAGALGAPASAFAAKKSAAFSRLDLYPNIETVGVAATGVNLSSGAELQYQGGDGVWRSGHPLVRIPDGRLIGSLFGLSPNTSYNVKVVDGSTEISGTVTTQADELQFNPAVVLHVDDNAPAGGNGSVANPFRTIQEGVNRATPGTQVLVADGVYHETVSFPTSGVAGNWIQIKAEGAGAILDGSENFVASWQPYPLKSRVWFAKIGHSVGYLARDGKRFYTYDNLTGLLDGVGHGYVSMNEGWYLDRASSTLYVRSLDKPSAHTWQAPLFDHAVDAVWRDWLWIEGFEMRFYGSAYGGCGVCATNASHVVIRKNRIHNMQLGVFINWTGGEERGNDTRVEYNEIYDTPVNEWPWKAVKATSMEGTAILVRGHIGEIVRGNELHNFFNGIYTGSSGAMENPGVAFDVDVYNNSIHHISDDGLEPEGACINHRFRNNILDTVYVGVSLAPITQGPTWVLRSLITNYSGRGIKWDRYSDGVVFIYHNTFWGENPSASVMEFINPSYNSTARNNIFQGRGYGVKAMPKGLTGHNWGNDNWYVSPPLNVPRFIWENVNYASLAKLCAATGLECNGYDNPSGLTNPSGRDFTLLASSPNIDRGVLIPGINDNFTGGAPDVGAYEFVVDAPPTVLSNVRSDPNPASGANVNFTVTFSEAVTGVDLADFQLTASPSVAGAFIASVTPVSWTTYIVGVNTGSGNGDIRLDVADNDSIVDSANHPLGGAGAGNGNFTGATYAIEKAVPVVTNISRANSNPASANVVAFTVAFSKEVYGVDASDFVLASAGNISGATIGEVSGFGTTYTVTVNAGAGDGALRLDLLDNDSIVDVVNNPLGGVGAGNGNYNAGEAYAIDKIAPTIASIVRAESDPATADTVKFTATFSEAVSGVDASDFVLATAGNVSGATVRDVGGSGTTYTVTVDAGAGDGALRLDLLDNDSIVDVVNNPLGGLGAGNGNYIAGEAYTVDKTAPIALSVLRADPNPVTADTVKFAATFSKAVGGVDAGDFALSTTGEVAGASVTSVSVGATPNIYLVTVNVGKGNGTLRLDVMDNDSVADAVGHPLGGAGVGNGNFAGGETYTINKFVAPLAATFSSDGTNDGWVLESRETSEQGGSKNSTSATFNLGDNGLNRQYRAVLHFYTSSLPANAVVTSVILAIKRQGLIGTNPFTTHQNILADIRSGAFGALNFLNPNALHETDFQAAASRDAVGVIRDNPIDGWYWTQLDAAAFPYINLNGATQFRLRFQLDDNNDKSDDYLKFFSGDYAAYRPLLRVEYYVP